MDIIWNINLIDFARMFFISLGILYSNFKLLGIKNISKRKVLFNILFLIVVNYVYIFVERYFSSIGGIIYIYILISINFSILTKTKLEFSMIVTLLAMAINYILYFITVLISFAIYKILEAKDSIIFAFIMIIYLNLLYITFGIRKLKDGLAFLKKIDTNDYFVILVLNISSVVLLTFITVMNIEENLKRVLLIFIVFFSIIMFITIQKSLQLYYKQKMLIKDLEETKAELENKRKEVEELEKENLNFSKVSHSIAHKQKSLEFKLNELSMNSEISSEISLKDRVDKLGKELAKETISVIEKTGIEEIDDMLKYMQAECIKNKIDFQLQLSGNIYTMINHYIDKEELEILLADHIKNAIIAISYTDNLNKSILVRLGKLDGYYGLYIYDSGIEFEVKTLYKLGKIPATTHKDNGGTGMGFMNTFDTLRKHKASFVIEEYGKPVKNNFTKALKFIFNEKNEFKIYSYRWEEIRKENKEDNFVIEKLNI